MLLEHIYDETVTLTENLPEWTLGEQDLLLDPEEQPRERQPQTSGFINQDYNLNSPLIADEAIVTFEYIIGENFNQVYKHRNRELGRIQNALNY